MPPLKRGLLPKISQNKKNFAKKGEKPKTKNEEKKKKKKKKHRQEPYFHPSPTPICHSP